MDGYHCIQRDACLVGQVEVSRLQKETCDMRRDANGAGAVQMA